MKKLQKDAFKEHVIRLLCESLLKPAERLRANAWHRFYWAYFYVSSFQVKYITLIILGTYFLAVALSFYFSPELQKSFEPFFSNADRISDIKAIFTSLGGALVGAGAISFSLVMFVLQVNIDRMPHGLFRKFSSDKGVILAFTAIFFLAAGLASLSVFIETKNAVLITMSAFFVAVTVIMLVIYAYRRTLALINPVTQLGQICRDTQKNLSLWRKMAERARPLLTPPKNNDEDEPGMFDPTHDVALTSYFQINSHWTAEALRSVNHAISYAKRYAEYGDYTVSKYAFDAIFQINVAYVEIKGKSFFANALFVDNPLTTDGFINNTLEQLRITLSTGFSRKDEQQIEDVLNAFARLASLYVNIDYSSGVEKSKQHANLALAYLSNGVQSALRHGFTDVVMQGLRWMGEAGIILLKKSSATEITTITKEIAQISCGGVINEKTRPIPVGFYGVFTSKLKVYKNMAVS